MMESIQEVGKVPTRTSPTFWVGITKRGRNGNKTCVSSHIQPHNQLLQN